ncbi:DNA-primase RepB domain-containing protein [Roseomonas chloroacetimidivorans]|uniref:DNA-primase RepB domain-containing protein n=1 Tax=Roseomonas chloroacetimidivorans TaxID=1766656 RepID=UPI003C7169D4
MPLTPHSAGRGERRTRESIIRWAQALPAAQYAITAVPAELSSGTSPHRRVWDIGELERAVPWLRRLNANGHHILGRPIDPRHVLIDDLHRDAVTALSRHHRPAVVVASSPGNLQVWLTISDTPIAPTLADAAAKLLAARYVGDLCAARASQPSRIPGLTNRKPPHQQATGLFPYALLLRADGPVLDPGGPALLSEARSAMEKVGKAKSLPSPNTPTSALHRSPAEEHAAGVARVLTSLPPGAALDRSRADFATARRLAQRGFSVPQIIAVILTGDRARGPPPSSAEVYARRTAEAACAERPSSPQD